MFSLTVDSLSPDLFAAWAITDRMQGGCVGFGLAGMFANQTLRVCAAAGTRTSTISLISRSRRLAAWSICSNLGISRCGMYLQNTTVGHLVV